MATSSNAEETKATGSNAAMLSAIPKQTALQVNASAVGGKAAAPYGKSVQFNLRVSGYEEGESITVEVVDEKGKIRHNGSIKAAGYAQGKVWETSSWLEPGNYKIYFTNADGENVLAEEEYLTFAVEKAALKYQMQIPYVGVAREDIGWISLLMYGAITYSDTGETFKNFFSAEPVLEKDSLEAGKYKITDFYLDESEYYGKCATLETSLYQNAYLLENFGPLELTAAEISGETEVSRNIFDLFPTLQLVKEETGLVKSVELGKLSEEDALKFKTAPQLVDGFLSLAMKKESTEFDIALPLRMMVGDSKYGETRLTVTVRIFSEAGPDGFRSPHIFAGRTEDEVKLYYKEHPFSTSKSVTYDRKPDLATWQAGTLSESTTPSPMSTFPLATWQAGTLSEETITDGLNAMNFMRYIAGIPEVSYDRDYEKLAMAGSILNSLNGKLSHFPTQPAKVPDDFYEIGSKGASSSNIGVGYRNISDSIITGYMDDGGRNNIDAVGHRCWILSDDMEKTGFGYYGKYTALYVFDQYGMPGTGHYDTTWPAAVMPYEYFSGPWSIDLSGSDYTAVRDELVITMTGKSSKKTCVIDKNANNVNGKYLGKNVDGSSLIVFKPDVSFSGSEEVEVTMTGLRDSYGEPVNIAYTVRFFKLGSSSGVSGSGSTGGGGSSGGGGGSSGGGGGGGGGSSKRVTSQQTTVTTPALPDYVVKGNWIQGTDGNWKFTDGSGTIYKSRWGAIYNPYANTAAGVQAFDWFLFDGNGLMITGWYTDPADGNVYYLNPNSDGTRGKMVTGWVVIDGKNYYFNPDSDGARGRMYRNETTKDGYQVGADGVWVQ